LIHSDQVKVSTYVWIIAHRKLSSIVDLDLPTTTDEASGDYYFALAYRSTLDKDYATAREASEKAVALGCSPAYLPAALNLKGTFAFLNRDANTALDCLSKAIRLDSSYVQCYIKRASIYIEQGKSGIAHTPSSLTP
jgi:import receptor subunit TOM70